MEILGIKISGFSLDKLENVLLANKKTFLVTLNPEIIVKAQKDEEYFYILNQADISVVDGYGLKLACLLLKKQVKRITGADLTIQILNLAEKLNKKVAIVNRLDGLSSQVEIRDCIKKKWPNLACLVINQDKSVELLEGGFQVDIVFVNFGAPYQEKFIYQNLEKFDNLKLALGVGGSFDFITQKIKRAPQFLRNLGLEWLWRLLQQPKRIVRIFKATIVFSFKVIKWRYILPFFYRQNVVCFIYKQKDDKLEVLLVERRDQKGHWQLPQGGLDGEAITKAGMRETKEELNISEVEVRAVFKNLYKYKFDSSLLKYGHKGQAQNLLILKYLGTGDEIRVNYFDHRAFQFVDIKDLLSTVAPIRREAVEIYLNKFNQLKYEKK